MTRAPRPFRGRGAQGAARLSAGNVRSFPARHDHVAQTAHFRKPCFRRRITGQSTSIALPGRVLRETPEISGFERCRGANTCGRRRVLRLTEGGAGGELPSTRRFLTGSQPVGACPGARLEAEDGLRATESRSMRQKTQEVASVSPKIRVCCGEMVADLG